MEEKVQEPEAIKAEENEKDMSCPMFEPANNNMANLPYDEKLNIIEKDVQSWYKFCLEKKLTEKEIHTCVSGMYGPEKSVVKIGFDVSLKQLLVLAVIVAVVAVPFVHRGSMRFFQANLIFLMKYILSYWDWTKWHYEPCLIRNHWQPTSKPINITAEMCVYCGDFEIQRLSNVSQSFLSELLPKNDFHPFVVTDTVHNAKGMKLTMDRLVKLNQYDLMLEALQYCKFVSNAGFNKSKEFFNAYVDKSLPSMWHTSWSNCDVNVAKVIRGFFPRPYFLPLAMELFTQNTMITSSGVDPNASFQILRNHTGVPKGVTISVISGALRIFLTPFHDKCLKEFGCSNKTIDISSGETLFSYGGYWNITYQPFDSGNTVAIGNDVRWHNVHV